MTTRPRSACSALSTDGRPEDRPMAAAARCSTTAASRAAVSRPARSGRSKMPSSLARSSSTQPAVSLRAASAVPEALTAMVRPSADLAEVLPPPACTQSGLAPTARETSINWESESLSICLSPHSDRRDTSNNKVLLFAEVVRIHAADDIAGHFGNANAMLDHELGQFISVNEHDALLNLADILPRIVGETGRRDEHA